MIAYLITHVATQRDHTMASEGWTLSAQGRADADQLALEAYWREVQQVVVSSERKTLLSVAPAVSRYDLPVWVDCRLDELRRMGWVEDYAARVAEVFAMPNHAVGGWEPSSRTLARVLSAVRDVRRRFAPHPVAIVGHGMALSLLRASLLGQESPDLGDWSRLPFGAVAVADLNAKRLLQDFAPAADAVRL